MTSSGAGGALPESIRGIVFDLDGTLVDSYEAIRLSASAAVEAFGRPPLTTAETHRLVGHGLNRLIEGLLEPDQVPAGVRRFQQTYAEVFRAHTRALPGARDALMFCRTQGLPVAVASNKPAKFSRPILDALGIGDLVAAVHGPDTVGSTKPEPRMIRTCLEELQLLPTEAIYVGDMTLDVDSADRAGVAAVLVASGSATMAQLKSTGRVVLGGVGDLPGLLQRHRIK